MYHFSQTYTTCIHLLRHAFIYVHTSESLSNRLLESYSCKLFRLSTARAPRLGCVSVQAALQEPAF